MLFYYAVARLNLAFRYANLIADEIRTVLQNGITRAGHGSIRNCKEAVTPFPYGGMDNFVKYLA